MYMGKADSRIADILQRYESDLLEDWVKKQLGVVTSRPDLMTEAELRNESTRFLKLLRDATQAGNLTDINASGWTPLRDMMTALSASRARQGFSPSETAMFIFSFKEPLFQRLRQESRDVETLANDVWSATVLLDKLGLLTTETYQKFREEVIVRQQQELLELSTPVVQLWHGILALPVIGTLDSARTQIVMQNLLQKIVETGSAIAIIDITGVPVVDTLVAQHLLKTVSAARLMGADCIISGIRPQIAQTIVHLGVELGNIVTKATLADAFAVAIQRTGLAVTPAPSRAR
jgi:rsbT co-antagonist protein RsbR